MQPQVKAINKKRVYYHKTTERKSQAANEASKLYLLAKNRLIIIDKNVHIMSTMQSIDVKFYRTQTLTDTLKLYTNIVSIMQLNKTRIGRMVSTDIRPGSL